MDITELLDLVDKCDSSYNENLIRDFQDLINWHNLSQHQKLSEDFIRKFKDKVNWFNVSVYQKLSADFIIEFHDCVNWEMISRYQKHLSKSDTEKLAIFYFKKEGLKK